MFVLYVDIFVYSCIFVPSNYMIFDFFYYSDCSRLWFSVQTGNMKMFT